MLLSTISAANTRNHEATLMFRNIACVLDNVLNENKNIFPQHLHKPYRDFIANLSVVARRHFECHIKGSQRPPIPYSTTKIFQTEIENPVKHKNVNDSQHKLVKSYVSIASTTSVKQHSQATKKSIIAQEQARPKTQMKSIPEDNRLLVRIGPCHPALISSPYAIMLQFNAFL